MADAPTPARYSQASRTDGNDDGITEEQIRDIVFEFYDRVRRDALLGPVFEERLSDRWEPHLEKMCDFWSTVVLGTRSFRGNPMGAHVGLPGISTEHFDRWMELFVATAGETLPGPAAADITGRAARMRVALERAACPNSDDSALAGQGVPR